MSAQEKTTGQLAGDILNDVTNLVKAEGELARSEIRGGMNDAIAGAASLGIAIALLMGGLTVALIALGALLSSLMTMEPWVGQAIAAAIGIVIGLVLLQTAKSKMKDASPVPTRTAQNIRRDANAVREAVQ